MKNFVRITGAIIALVIFFCDARGQNADGTVVNGSILDNSTKQPLEFANVYLLKAADSSVIKNTVTDKKGRFEIEGVVPGNYIVQYSFIGYGKKHLAVVIKETDKKIEAGVLVLSPSGQLKEVEVTADKELMNVAIDRKIYNVEQDVFSESGSASDILKNIPSVEVGIDGDVSLRGSADVMILINGKPSPLMGKTRAEVLAQLPAKSIERIEVITNPSAKYKPDGTGGIINIVLKKNTDSGLNGTITGSLGNKERYNGNVFINYKPGDINIYGSAGIRKDDRRRFSTINREIFDSTGHDNVFNLSGYYDENGLSISRPLSTMATLGAEYEMDDNNTIGISSNYYYRELTRNDVIRRISRDESKVVTGDMKRFRHDPEYEEEKEFAVTYSRSFDKENKEVQFEFSTSSSPDRENNKYMSIYYTPSSADYLENLIVTQSDKQKSFTIDYSNPISDSMLLEAGYDGSFNNSGFNFYSSYYNDSSLQYIRDNEKSSYFKYEDAVHAIYITLGKTYKKIGIKGGLRAEQVLIKGNLVTLDSLFDNDYFRIYPTLHLSYKIKKDEVQFNYSRRVSRPDPDELNPFPEYQDPRNLWSGNPNLLPEMIHSVEIGYKRQRDKITFTPSVYYRYKQNGFTSITSPVNDTTLLTTLKNLSNDKSAGLELIFSLKPAKWATVNVSSNTFYNKIDASELGYSNNKDILSTSASLSSNLSIYKNTVAQVSANFRSARLTAQGQYFSNYVINGGIRYNFMKNKMSTTLTASDIFRTLRQKYELDSPFFHQVSIGKRDTRIIYLSLLYKFGKIIKKNKEEGLQFDDKL